MSPEKLIIKPRKYRGETTVISSRLPNDMVREIDAIAASTGRNRNEIVLKCLAFALDRYERAPEDFSEREEN